MPETAKLSPEKTDFPTTALILQGGGALGSYQAGVYAALAEGEVHPTWVAGISIGAINCALIAGNPPERRVERLRKFWEGVTESPFGLAMFDEMPLESDMARVVASKAAAMRALMWGVPHFFSPRPVPPFFQPPGTAAAISFYDTSALRSTLEAQVDFDLLNSGATRFSVGAVNVRSGNFVYFDNTRLKIGPEHIMASGSLPPGLPATEIEGEHYWDGGLVSNTPLEWVFQACGPEDMLIFQVDLWRARGEMPRNLIESDVRQKEIRYSSRTRTVTDNFVRLQRLRRMIGDLLAELPPDSEFRRKERVEALARMAHLRCYNIVHLIYRSPKYEGASEDYEFSRRAMEAHWQAGYNDTIRTLRHPEALRKHTGDGGVFTFDIGHSDGD
jgi:NTE family protein